jgi:hypothetical protein
MFFHQFPRYDTKILLRDFSAKAGKEDIFKPTIWKESSHDISTDNGAGVVNFATSKNLVAKVQFSLFATFITTSEPLLKKKTHNQTVTF